LEDPQAVVVVEWAGVVENVLPAERISVVIKPTGENAREFSVSLPQQFAYLKGDN
jgi:tRNA A37 threonylcarbamoyladenosine biosynthesis protein TsaE